MFTNNPLGHDYNEPMVDRLLGKAYQTIKEVHESLPDIAQAIAVGEDSKKVTASVDKLTATLKGFKEGTGLFIGHDLGEVGVEDSKDTYIGDNFLSELTKSGTNVKTVGDNVSTINRLAEHINELKAIAEALTSLLTVKDSLNEVDTINQNIEKIKTVANNSSNINSVYDCLDNINALAGSINDFPELIEHAEDIATVAEYLSSIVTVANNIVGFNDRITTNANNIANHEERISANETELADHEARITENTSDIESLGSRATALETLTAEHSETIESHENRLRNIETTTDAGKWAEKLAELDATDARHDASLKALEDKNSAQDTALSEETQARIAKDTELESTISNTIDTTINNLPNKYVTLDTPQTITGTKVIKSSSGSSIFLQDTRFDRKTSPEQDIFNSIVFTDKNAKNAGFVQSVQRKDSNNAFYLAATRDKEGNTDIASLGVVFPRDTTKVAYATAPQTPTLASNNEIATAKFVIDKITPIKANYVTTNTDQTITGKKTLTTTNKAVVTKIKVTNTDNTVTPTENLWTNAVNVVDKNGKGEGALQFSRRIDGRNWVTLQSCIQNANGNDITSSIGIGLKADGTAITTAPNTDSNATGSEIATAKFVNDKINAVTTGYVTTDTTQTISGDKSFTQKREPFRIKDANFDVSKTPSQTISNSIVTYDKNNKQVGYYQVLQESNGNNTNSINAVNYKTDGTTVRTQLKVGINEKGTTYTFAPKPSASSNDNNIATTSWVNDKVNPIKNNYVTTNTEQTITGKKTLTTTNKAEVVAVKVTNTDSTVTPTENLWTNVISVYDKNTHHAGALQFSRQPDGMNWVKLQAANQNTNGSDTFQVIGVGIKSDGTASTSAPNPASNSNDTSIATTAWVNTKISAETTARNNAISTAKTDINNTKVTTNTNQTISGAKTFSAVTKSATPASNSNDTSVATTSWVNTKVNSLQIGATTLNSTVIEPKSSMAVHVTRDAFGRVTNVSLSSTGNTFTQNCNCDCTCNCGTD